MTIAHDIKDLLTEPKLTLSRIRNMRRRAQLSQLLGEIFIRQSYYWLYSNLKKNTTLIDIGANVGDTAIYFAMGPNVRKVFAYEPIPSTYKEALTNLEDSPYKGKIVLFNAAIMERHLEKRISQNQVGGVDSDFAELRNLRKGKVVKALTLADALKGKRNVAIKCDCEGCEHRIFTKGVDLSNVYALRIEVGKEQGDIPELLKDMGFEVSIYHNRYRIGYVCAKRRTKR